MFILELKSDEEREIVELALLRYVGECAYGGPETRRRRDIATDLANRVRAALPKQS